MPISNGRSGPNLGLQGLHHVLLLRDCTRCCLLSVHLSLRRRKHCLVECLQFRCIDGALSFTRSALASRIASLTEFRSSPSCCFSYTSTAGDSPREAPNIIS